MTNLKYISDNKEMIVTLKGQQIVGYSTDTLNKTGYIINVTNKEFNRIKSICEKVCTDNA